MHFVVDEGGGYNIMYVNESGGSEIFCRLRGSGIV